MKRVRHCFKCLKLLHKIFIQCDECDNIDICTACFAQGSEVEGLHHLNTHRYRIMRDDFFLFGDWTARDELILLDQLSSLGPSNWIEVVKSLKCSPAECEKHYVDYYLKYPIPELPTPPSPEKLYRPIPMIYRSGTHDPPRPLQGSVYQRDMGGYCAARGDFQFEVFQNAELEVASIDELTDEEDEGLTEALSLAVLDIYNNKLRERFRRKRIVREHGLINIHRHLATRYRYDSTLTHRVCERLSVFAQVIMFNDFSKLFASLHS